MSNLNSTLNSLAKPFTGLAPWLLRLTLGIAFFLHGYSKFPLPPEDMVGWFGSIGIPAPEIISSMVAIGETTAGVGIILGGAYKKISVFDAFIDGAKNGFDVIIKIIPYLVAMLVAIRVLRDSGAMIYILNGLTYLIQLTGVNTEFIGALPVAIMKPLSGSGARGMMLDIFQTQGPDSFVGKMASIFQGSADTTFYIIALYFGSVGIKKIRYALWAGIFADLIGVVIAIFIGYTFFK